MNKLPIYQQKPFLYALACMSTLLMLARCGQQANKRDDKHIQKATVVNYANEGDDQMMHVLLDTDGNRKTAESICEIPLENIHPFTTNDVKQLLPVGATRTMWEWNKLGRVSKFEQR